MKKIIILLFITTLVGITSFAQTASKEEVKPITFKGKIHFERKQNVHKQLDERAKGSNGNNEWIEMAKKQNPKYKTDQFELFFTDQSSVYKPAPEGITESKMMMMNMPADRNIVYNDYANNKCIAEKKIFEKTYLVSDTFKNYNWKIKEEFRTIAGFSCRRAETIIMDSIYVIAFYSDAILAEGGPEGFSGLPGMILGVVIPRLNLTYFATKVDNYLPTEKELVIPSKGDKKDYAQLNKKIKESVSQWGEFMNVILWYVNL